MSRRFSVPARAGLLGLLGLFGGAVSAASFAPREPVELPAGHGGVLVVVNSGHALESIWLERADGAGREKYMSFPIGTSLRVLTLPPGRYAWSRLRVKRGGDARSFDVRLEAPMVAPFEVEAGVIAYAGDLDVSASLAGWWVAVESQDRLARALQLFEQEYPGVRARLPLRWKGDSPDRFIELLDAARGTRDVGALSAELVAAARRQLQTEVDPTLVAAVQELFPAEVIDRVEANPAGTRVLVSRSRQARTTAQIVDTATRKAVAIYDDILPLAQADWVDDDTLVIGSGGHSLARVEVFRVRPARDDALALESFTFPGPTRLLHAFGGARPGVLVEYLDRRGESGLFRVGVGGKRIDAAELRRDRRLDKGIEDAVSVMADDSGLRVAFVPTDGALSVRRRAPAGEWTAAGTLPASIRFTPLALTADGGGLYALSDHERAHVELVRFDFASGAISGTVHAVPGVDLDGARFDAQHRLVSVAYHRQGLLEIEPVGSVPAPVRDALAVRLPGRTVVPFQTGTDGRRTLAFAFSETDPGAWVMHDAADASVATIASVAAPFSQVQPVTSSVVRARSRDGLDVEAYLSLPRNGRAPHPLVVMPHGGPQGVRDTRAFDAETQLLVHLGHAVLRVNFRGSSGYGRNFREGGQRNWGRGIEDDILAALDAALAAHPLDASRVALRGASYGGYSTLMGLVRSPERFRCGIAIAAVTDLPLMFVAGDGRADRDARRVLETLLGDPRKQLAELEAVSPTWRHTDLRQPLLLVHGSSDRRVPVEHSLRLGLVLAAAGRVPALLAIEHAGHGDFNPRARLAVEAASQDLLTRCLAPR